jgi:hypothetical protein
VYHDVWKPNTIAAIRTSDRRKVFNTALAVGNSQTFILSILAKKKISLGKTQNPCGRPKNIL